MGNRAITRESVRRGSQLSYAKLDEAKVREIHETVRKRRQIDAERAQYTDTALAKRFGVSRKTIENAVSGSTWGHVDEC